MSDPRTGSPSPADSGPAAAALPDDGDERELVARLRDGEEAAYEELVRRHGPRLLAAARRVLRNEDDAREAFQEAMLSAFKSIGTFAGDARLGTWLHRIAVNAALMKLRSVRRVREDAIEDLLPSFTGAGHVSDPVAPWSEPADVAAQRSETREHVRRSIDQLPDTYRVPLVLRDLEEMDTADVARLLGITPNAVKIRIHRGRQALRALLDPRLRKP